MFFRVRRVHKDLAAAWKSTPCFPWYARVPSASSVADSASRLEELPGGLSRIAKRVTLNLEGLCGVDREEKLAMKRRRVKVLKARLKRK